MRLLDNRHAYTLLLWLAYPYIWLHLLWRARRQREYLQHIGERFGNYTSAPDKPVIWLHTVSVGETRATATLILKLRERYPDHRILLTHTTPTGRAASEQLYGDEVMRVYLPYDYPFAVRRFLRHFRPRIGVLMETEVWFNLIHECRAERIPLLLLNARLSQRSAQRYAKFPRLTRSGLHELHLIAAQTEDDAMRLADLGNRAVPVMGNLKFEIEPPAAMLELGRHLRSLFGEKRRVFLAASTREGEEALLLDALPHADVDNLLVVIVPRHPQRFDEVAALIENRGMRMQRRSDGEPVSPHTQVVLGDSMGEMFAYYAAADIAFIGGSLLPLGGQNLIEACAMGTPALVGPHTWNFAQAVEHAVSCGAAIQVNHADGLVHQLNVLFHETGRLRLMGEAGLCFVKDSRGATERAMTHIGLALNYAIYNEIAASKPRF
jgi:3-deoxy-D-manno-octulosonic-acid transferase